MSSGRNASSGDGSAVCLEWVERELDDWEAVWQRGSEYLSMRGTRGRPRLGKVSASRPLLDL